MNPIIRTATLKRAEYDQVQQDFRSFARTNPEKVRRHELNIPISDTNSMDSYLIEEVGVAISHDTERTAYRITLDSEDGLSLGKFQQETLPTITKVNLAERFS